MSNGLVVGLLAVLTLGGADSKTSQVWQSRREIPVAHDVDVVVLGGSLAAVSAATEAAEAGQQVLLVAPHTYLGEQLSGNLALWLDDDEALAMPLIRRVFGNARVTTPLRVKQELEKALLDVGVDFLLASFPTDLVLDDAQRIAGVVIANRAGRQAILAKVVIDATQLGTAAQLAGVPWRVSDWDSSTRIRRIVLGGEQRRAAGEDLPWPDNADVEAWEPQRVVAAGVKARGSELSYFVFEREIRLGDSSFAAVQRMEQQARDACYRPGQLRASARVSFVHPCQLRSRAEEKCTSLSEVTVAHFQPQGLEDLFVLGTLADVDRAIASLLWKPGWQVRLGEMVGTAAAAAATERQHLQGVHVATIEPDSRTAGDIREVLRGLRPVGGTERTVMSPPAAIGVWSEVDVLVIGGGTSGACAAIAAARRGAAVLVVEFQEGLGGVGTVGLIGKPYHGLDRGFTAEVPFPDKNHNTEYKMEWFRRQIRAAGGEVWLGALGCGAYVEENRVRGAVIASAAGRGVVLAPVVIDATGNADIAVAAGAESMYGGGARDIALQGTGLPWRPLANSYVNTDYLLVDESDLVDTWRAFVGARLANEMHGYDVGSFIQARERRRVVGDHVLTYLDQIAERTYPDSVVLSGSDYDSHGYPSEPYFALIPHTAKSLVANHPAPGGTCYTPYRCFLPQGLEGMLVSGLGISMHRDASAMVRMQKDMHNQGFAVGTAAALAVENRCTPRQVDVKRLQHILVEIGNLPADVLTDEDSFPMPLARVEAAVRDFPDATHSREHRCQALAVVLTHPQAARPLIRRALSAAGGNERIEIEYAKLLGFLGDSSAVPVLLEALSRVDDWDAKILQGKMAEYAHLPTPTDALILALGYSGDSKAIPLLVSWLDRLDADVTLSHHRSLALALEALSDPAAGPHIVRLLRKPGMSGHVMTSLEPLHNRNPRRRRRTGALREIVLARALYRCGDQQAVGRRILEQYCHDIRGLFARHASAVLAE